MAHSRAPLKNHLLAALPDAEWQRWLPQLEEVDMPLGEVLYESDNTSRHVPTHQRHRFTALRDGKGASAVQPILAAMDSTAVHCESC